MRAFAIRPSLNKMSDKTWYPGCATWWLLSCTQQPSLLGNMSLCQCSHIARVMWTFPPNTSRKLCTFIYTTPSWECLSLYSGPCILRPPIQPEKYGIKLKVVLKWRDIYVAYISVYIRVVSLMATLKIEGNGIQWSLYFTTLYLKTTLHYKTAWFGHKAQFSVLNDLYFKTTWK